MIQPEGFCSVEVKLLENGDIGNFNLSASNFPQSRAGSTGRCNTI